ncbi:hypothetical protein K2173_008982 [Erythroxylum novogranatense]|uniref:Uncharacterized protein n=1 Tax=Erythroxylum novogranatense TaxID=1862640 RepID=A0AAV8TSH3_9ROSI|nr:hypothetical protein K2173_008982 [Erythroxylum novogranatense]
MTISRSRSRVRWFWSWFCRFQIIKGINNVLHHEVAARNCSFTLQNRNCLHLLEAVNFRSLRFISWFNTHLELQVAAILENIKPNQELLCTDVNFFHKEIVVTGLSFYILFDHLESPVNAEQKLLYNQKSEQDFMPL